MMTVLNSGLLNLNRWVLHDLDRVKLSRRDGLGGSCGISIPIKMGSP
jgi:hypothetical protein